MNQPYAAAELIDEVALSAERADLENRAASLRRLHVPDRFLSDCEMLAIGAFTPFSGFMNREEVDSIVKHMSLPNGLVWGAPVMLLAGKQEASSIRLQEEIALCDGSGRPIALMIVNEKYEYPVDEFCREIFRTTDLSHPGVRMIKESPEVFLAGPVKLLARPSRKEVDPKYYLDPRDTRKEFERRGWKTIVAFQTRNPMHRAHEFLIKKALESVDGALIHPLVGETKSDDIPAGVRIRCYEVLIDNYFDRDKVMLSVLPTYMRYAGPREAINHAIIRKNYGCTHFIVGRDHAGVGNHYGRYEAQELLSSYAARIGITAINFENVFFCRRCGDMVTEKTCPHTHEEHVHLSGTKVRNMLKEGTRPPLEFSRKEVIDILMEWTKNERKTA